MTDFLPGISQTVEATYYYGSGDPLPITGHIIFRYVPHDSVEDYLGLGWIVQIPKVLHGQFDRNRVEMRWLCGCKCVEPYNG